jgi:hypothetical protein
MSGLGEVGGGFVVVVVVDESYVKMRGEEISMVFV